MHTAPEQAIREIHSTWIGAVNQGEIVALLNLMAEDAVFLGPGVTPTHRDEFSSHFSAAHQQARIECISELQDVVVVAEVAYTLSRDTLSFTPRAGGDTMQFAGYRSTVYRRQPDDRWLLVLDIHTLTPLSAPKSAT